MTMLIKRNEQDYCCFICRKQINENFDLVDESKLSDKIIEGEKVETYYLIGKVRVGKKTGNGSVVACESCWHEYAGFEVEDDYDLRKRRNEILKELSDCLDKMHAQGNPKL